MTLRWRHNGSDSVSNHQPYDCLLNYLYRRRSKKTSKLRITGLCVGNSPETGEFPAQMASNAENISIWWRHHENRQFPNHNKTTQSVNHKNISWDALHSYWILKQLGNSKHKKFHFMSISINVICLYQSDPIQWIFGQHYRYWWPGALASGRQQLQCRVRTHAFQLYMG